MNAFVNGLWLMVNRFLKTIQLFRLGFTIIEILIVLSLIGIAASLVTASYLNFERRQRIKNAALDMKSQIRFAQNKALSGDKGFDDGTGDFCDSEVDETLVGWYLDIGITSSQNTYIIYGDCLTASGEKTFGDKSISLPKDVEITKITYNILGLLEKTSVNILYRPLDIQALFFDGNDSPPFLNDDGEFINLLDLQPQESLTITLEGPDSTAYEVEIQPTGEVDEKKL